MNKAAFPLSGVKHFAVSGEIGYEGVSLIPLIRCQGRRFERRKYFVNGIGQDIDSLPIAFAGKILGYDNNIDIAARLLSAGGVGSVKDNP
ncbi:uncharacterized protein Dmul_33780 [Desulfococcus multivorans]|nr:uncharacterized protein Dmul_33780 [Desulfococcus multivorans]